jgi:ribosomal protein S18 acetylase RimI-like enzyme
MGAAVTRSHQEYDARRFLLVEDLEAGYLRYFSGIFLDRDTVFRVATPDSEPGSVVGYAYGQLEQRNWATLLDAHGAVHELWVEPEHRGQGLAERLVRSVARELVARGAPRVVVYTAEQNARAQRLMERLGFRRTLIEFTLEADELGAANEDELPPSASTSRP